MPGSDGRPASPRKHGQNCGAMAGRNQGDTLKSFQFRHNHNPKWEAINIKPPGGVLAPLQWGVKAWLALAYGFVQGGQGGVHKLARRNLRTMEDIGVLECFWKWKSSLSHSYFVVFFFRIFVVGFSAWESVCWHESTRHIRNIKFRYCGFWSNRTLLYFPLSVRSFVRPSQVWHINFSRYFDYYTMKTIYFLNAYHLGW